MATVIILKLLTEHYSCVISNLEAVDLVESTCTYILVSAFTRSKN